MRCFRCLIILVLVTTAVGSGRDSARMALGQTANGSPATVEPLPFASSRELLQSMGVDDSHLHLLVDGRPLDQGEQEPLLRVLYAVRRFPLEDIDRWTQTGKHLPDEETSLTARGQIHALRGKVVEVHIEKPLPEVVKRLELKQYYRCQLLLGDDASPATIFALEIPQTWPINQRFSERISCRGFFLKLAPGEDDDLQPVFAAQRVAWHPAGVLGDLGMDFGLFDRVKNKSPIGAQERECFYQMLAAAGRAKPDDLLQRTQRPPEDDYSVVPLFNEADSQHGKLVALTGTARRAIRIRLDAERERDIITRFGLDHYYQIEIFTADSQNNPLVFCVRELPTGLPEGPNIYETVRIPGFFFKTWAYRIQGTDEQPVEGKQLAPMLIGRQPLWIARAVKNPLAGVPTGLLFVAGLLAIALVVWGYNRSDRKFRQRAIARRYEPEQGRSLNDLDIPSSPGPDFRHLQ